MSKSFDTLIVWQRAHELMLLIHRKITPAFPAHEKWDLTDQIRRSSKSVPANIAEGHGRFYFRETIRFCYTARGSLAETENHLIAGRDLGYIPTESYAQARRLSTEVYRLLNGYIAYLKQERPGHDEPGHNVEVRVEPEKDEDTQTSQPRDEFCT